MELDKLRGEVIAARFQVDRTRQSEVTHGVAGARVGVASVGDGANGGGELALARLLAKGVAPLERAGGCLHDPSRRQGRGFAFGADVVQHHHQDVITVGGTRADMVNHSVNNKAGGVAVPGLAGFDFVVGQEGGPGGFDGAVGVVLQRRPNGFLTDKQKSFALGR